MGFELLGLGYAVSKTIENGNRIYIFIFLFYFLIIGTRILRKIRLGNGIETPFQSPLLVLCMYNFLHKYVLFTIITVLSPRPG